MKLIVYTIVIASVLASIHAAPTMPDAPPLDTKSEQEIKAASTKSASSIKEGSVASSVAERPSFATRAKEILSHPKTKIAGAVTLGAAAIAGLTATGVLAHQKHELKEENSALKDSLAAVPPAPTSDGIDESVGNEGSDAVDAGFDSSADDLIPADGADTSDTSIDGTPDDGPSLDSAN